MVAASDEGLATIQRKATDDGCGRGRQNFLASHLGTVVEFVHTYTHIHPTHACLTHTSHVQTNLPISIMFRRVLSLA